MRNTSTPKAADSAREPEWLAGWRFGEPGVIFAPSGAWICDGKSNPWRWADTVEALMHVLAQCITDDLNSMHFRVREDFGWKGEYR